MNYVRYSGRTRIFFRQAYGPDIIQSSLDVIRDLLLSGINFRADGADNTDVKVRKMCTSHSSFFITFTAQRTREIVT
jgi:hypothetical protein